jgi:hypothetical protein
MIENLSRKTNFVLQQGLAAPSAESCPLTYSGLLFQPRLVGVVAVIGTVAEVMGATAAAAGIFAGLAALLWWSAALPRWSPFDFLYNKLFAKRSGFRLEPAPGPRRFAQTLAGAFSFAIALLIGLDHAVAAFIVDAVFLAAIAALVFGGLCVGSYVFHLLTGRRTFANRTLPWSVILMLFAVSMFTGCRTATSTNNGTLVGAWRSKIIFRSGPLAGMKDLDFLYAYNAGGTMTESSNYDEAANSSPPAYGVWRAINGQRFETKYVFFTTEQGEGAPKNRDWWPAGHGVLTEIITLSDDGRTYTSTIRLATFDTTGKPLADGSGEGTGAGTRIVF